MMKKANNILSFSGADFKKEETQWTQFFNIEKKLHGKKVC